MFELYSLMMKFYVGRIGLVVGKDFSQGNLEYICRNKFLIHAFCICFQNVGNSLTVGVKHLVL